MLKKDIVERIKARLGISRLEATQAVDSVFSFLKEALAAGERIELRGFGVFQVKARKTGIGRNPKTGEIATIPKGKTVKFKAGKDMNSVLSG